MENFLLGLGLPKQLDLARLSETLNEYFLFEEERELLYLKLDTSKFLEVNDFVILLSKLGISISGRESLKTALKSSSLERRRWIPHIIESLPSWDGVDRISQLSRSFKLLHKEQEEIHCEVLRYWMCKSVQMVLFPEDINAVNRTVLTYQSSAQGIGKTTFARWLAEPFKRGSQPSIKELDYPDNNRDVKVELGKNFICLLDDINSWDARGLKNFKSVISSKTINARLPYAPQSSYLSRTASFIATTNEDGFLNESGNTRWAIFNLQSIDFDYTNIDQQQLWSQARDSVYSGVALNEQKVREYCIKSSEQHNVVTELDEIVKYWFVIDPDNSARATELFEQLPVQDQQYFGYKGGALSKFTKSIQRVFGNDNIYFKSSGYGKWRLKISEARRIR